jgi:hypothetical protein
MNLVIFGMPEKWDAAVNLIVKYRPDIAVCGLCYHELTGFEQNEAVLTVDEVEQLYKAKEIDGVIQINAENPYYFMLLRQIGIQDIYVIPQLLYFKAAEGKDISGDKICYSYYEVLPEWWQFEYHLADHCNLNCKGCTHFSNLVLEPVFADKEQLARDLIQLKKYFSYVHYFYLLGGEPLLNPELGEYVRLFRQNLPYTQLTIVTNGILVPLLKEDVLETIRDNHVQVSISDYTDLNNEKTEKFLESHDIAYTIRGGKENFGKTLNLKGDSEPVKSFYTCPRRHCSFLGRGKIAPCCQPFVAHYFNDYFGEHLIEGEGIDLYEEGLDGWTVAERLFSPMESCRFCTDEVRFEWDTTKAPFHKEDWCVKL